MIEIALSSSFKKAFKKRIKGSPSEDRFWKKVELFMQEPFHTSLRTHKLSGELKNLWSFSVKYDLRVVFYFSGENKVVFVDIGSHDEVY